MPRLIDMKRCTRCRLDKSLSEFHRRQRGPDGYSVWCKACVLLNKQEWRSAHPEAYRRGARVRKLRQHYGMTVETYDRLVEAQGGRCAICGIDTPGHGQTSWSIDHCHDTGRVRGLLCFDCNTAIGYFRNNPTALRAAADYLERSDDHRSIRPLFGEGG